VVYLWFAPGLPEDPGVPRLAQVRPHPRVCLVATLGGALSIHRHSQRGLAYPGSAR